MREVKEKAARRLAELAVKSVKKNSGRSMPLGFHEVEIPEEVKAYLKAQK